MSVELQLEESSEEVDETLFVLGLDQAPVTAEGEGQKALDWFVPTPTAVNLPGGDRVPSQASTHPGTSCIIAGSRNSLAVSRNGGLYSWQASPGEPSRGDPFNRGWNSHDTLGLDCDAEWVKTPHRVQVFPWAGVDDSHKAEEEEPELLVHAATKGIKQASLGGWHALAVDHEGQCFAWGGNEYGQAGVDCGTAGNGVHVSLHLSIPAAVLCGIRIKQVACGGMNSFSVVEGTGEVYQWGQTAGSVAEPSREPAKVEGVSGVVLLASGSFHVLALQEDGRVLSWGNGDYGQLGLGRPGNEDEPQVIESLSGVGVCAVAAGGWHSAALTANGACYVWGRGEYGRLGLGSDCADKPRPVELQISQRIVQIALGGTHTCLLDDTGTVLSFGRNSLGRLGRVANGKWTGTPGQVVFPPPPGGGRWRCTSVAAGGRHNMATAVPVGRAEEEAERLASAVSSPVKSPTKRL